MEHFQENLFVEQAEYLDPIYFNEWNTSHPDEESILRKLQMSGAKLLTGPRGSGKTTLLLKAYNKMIEDPQSQSFPIYVNFKSSLKLEPLYRNNANAVYWFNQWLLLKIYQGLYESILKADLSLSTELELTEAEVKYSVGQLELGQSTLNSSTFPTLDFISLESDINYILTQLDKARCILLLDDAAHAFSPEQQRDFFDFFRQLKSRTISPKAAIYPGVTIYSSTFHVGHDAEEVNIWLNPSSKDYIDFLTSILQKRLPTNDFLMIKSDEALFKLICYASFGLPRSLLNMVRSFTNDKTEKIEISRSKALTAIKEVFDNTLLVYRSLEIKLPIYSEFVTAGEAVYFRAIDAIKTYNKDRDIGRQSITIAIQQPLPSEFAKALGFLQYSGLLMPSGQLSKGEKGVFDLYIIHYAGIIDRNAFFGRTNINMSDYVEAFDRRNAHSYTRVNPRTLVGKINVKEAFPLSLPPCQVCHTPRINETAKFCLSCGNQLKSVSAFDTIINQDISALPLTAKRASRIKSHSRIKTIKDILIDHEYKELRSVPQVGPYWATRIYAYAEEFIA